MRRNRRAKESPPMRRIDASASWHRSALVNGRLFLVLRRVFDDALRDLVRNLLVPLEALREGRSALRHRLQRSRITVQLGLRYNGAYASAADGDSGINGLGAEDVTAPRGKIAQYVAHVLVRRDNVDLGERLEKDGLALRRHRLERLNARHLE